MPVKGDYSDRLLVPFVCDLVQAGSEILTDGWRGYNALVSYERNHARFGNDFVMEE